MQRAEKELSKVYVCIEGIRKILSASQGGKKSVNYPASKYLMRFAAERAQRRGKGQGKQKRGRERKTEREEERERQSEGHNKNNNMRGIRSSLTKTNREK